MSKKLLATVLCVAVIAACAVALVACGGGSSDQNGGAGASYDVSCKDDAFFGEYYTLYSDYILVGAGKTVTVTVDYEGWNFLEAVKVYANGVECAAGSAANTYTFRMPAEDVVVTAEMRVLDVPNAEDGMGWTRMHDLVADGINNSFEVTFGTAPVNGSRTFKDNGYSTLTYVDILSTDGNVIPAEAVQSVVGDNGVYVNFATITFDSSLISPGETTLILIDKDHDRAVTLNVTVVARDY